MSIYELIIISVGLAADAFAVSVCNGLKQRKFVFSYAVIIALFFGFFQAFMPALGFFLGKQFEKGIVSFDHWLAFGLLAVIGINMIIEAIRDNDGDDTSDATYVLDIKELTLMAIATSIDALAVGVTFAFLKVSIITAASLIGIITFIIALCGVFIGNRFGAAYKNKAEIAGGIILILMGGKILLEHLNIL